MDRLAHSVAARWREARAPSKSPRAPTKFQPRIKLKDWVDVTDPSGEGDYSDVTVPGKGNFTDITKVTQASEE